MSGTKRTILHLITGLSSGGGAETFLGRVLPRVTHHEPVVCSMRPPGDMSRKLEQAGVPVHSLHMTCKYDPGGILRYRQLLRDLQPDMQVHYLFHADVFGRVFGKRFGVPTVISFLRNKHQGWLVRLAERCTLPLADGVLANSRAVMDYYREQYDLPDHTGVIPNGIPLPDRNLDTDYLYGEVVEEEDVVVTSVARLHPQKCLDTLINASALLTDEISNIQVLLVGEGEQRDELEALVSRLQLEDHVQLLGHRDDVYQILSVTDVFVLPSEKEGMSNALLEAMASALPCVVSDIPENAELVTDDVHGRTFRLNDADDLARQILDLSARPDLRTEYGTAARDRIESDHTIDAILDTFERTMDRMDNTL